MNDPLAPQNWSDNSLSHLGFSAAVLGCPPNRAEFAPLFHPGASPMTRPDAAKDPHKPPSRPPPPPARSQTHKPAAPQQHTRGRKVGTASRQMPGKKRRRYLPNHPAGCETDPCPPRTVRVPPGGRAMSTRDFTSWLHQITGHSAPHDWQNQLAIRRKGKNPHLGSVTNLRGKSPLGCAVPPERLILLRFRKKTDAWMGDEGVLQAPSIDQGDGLVAKCLRVGCQTQNALLSHPAKCTVIAGQGIKLRLGRNVTDVELESQGQPEIDIREKDHLRPQVPPRDLPSRDVRVVAWTERAANARVPAYHSSLAGRMVRCAMSAQRDTRRRHPRSPATPHHRATPLRRCVLDLERPCRHCWPRAGVERGLNGAATGSIAECLRGKQLPHCRSQLQWGRFDGRRRQDRV